MTGTLQERRWANAIDRADFGVWDLDPGLELVHYSPRWKAHLGFPRIRSADSSAFWRCRVHPDDFAPMLHALRAHLDGSLPTYEARFRLRSNGAGYRTVVSRGRVVARDGSGNALRMVGTMVDLNGPCPAAPKAGLVSDGTEAVAGLPNAPFHAVLGADDAAPARSKKQRHRLADRVGDLLDIALRESRAAR